MGFGQVAIHKLSMEIYFDTSSPDCVGVAVRAFGPEQTGDANGSCSPATSTTAISTTDSSTVSSTLK
ncbi:hypothetical protein JCM33374_g5289 [Metschnikowia sp. JCM 33374]|nr:hypothetical protein JCM33374_g5289 [Metschnikowia sp. JCM 33374]